MNLKHTVSAALAVLMLAAPATAHAQLGGFAKKLVGGSGSQVSSDDAEAFLTKALLSTKNVMISSSLLAQALTNRAAIAEQKANIDAINGASSFGELEAHETKLKGDLDALTARNDLTADLAAAYNDADEHQKKVIATAIANLALGIYRNVDLVGSAPGMLESVGTNPRLLNRVGEFKLAASLIGLQGKGLGAIGSTLPKVMTALKVQPLPEAETTEPMPIEI